MYTISKEAPYQSIFHHIHTVKIAEDYDDMHDGNMFYIEKRYLVPA